MTEPNPSSQQPAIDVITSAYSEVLEHNSKNTGFGAIFGGILDAAMEAEEADPDISAKDIYKVVGQKLDSATELGDMNGELQSIVHGDAFLRIGLEIAPDGLFVKDGEGKRAGTTELRPQLRNTELFADFIENLDSSTAGNDEGVLKLVADVNTTLSQRIRLCFGKGVDGLSPGEQEMLPEIGEDALRSFVRLEQAYEKVGLDRPELYEKMLSHDMPNEYPGWRKYKDAEGYKWQYDALTSYVEYWGEGVLSERIAIGTPESNQKVGLAYFDGLQRKMTEEIEGILEVVGKQHSHDFGIKVAAAKLKSLEDTLKLMDEEPDHWIIIDKDNRKLVEDNVARLKAAISS